MYWKLEKKLTQQQKDVLKQVCFPTELKLNQRVQKRVCKIPVRGGFVMNPQTQLTDIKYLVVTANVAKYFQGYTLTEEAQRAEQFTTTYFDAKTLDAELESLLNKYAPSATPSMLKAIEEAQQEEEGLTDEMKAQAKELVEQGKDLKEIAKALGVAQRLVKPYLLTLNK